MKFSLILCPDDRAVANNNGRPGARKGPEALLKELEKINANTGVLDFLTIDNVIIDLKSIEQSHLNTMDSIKDSLHSGLFPIVIGGGHDYAYPHLAACSDFQGYDDFSCINIDPHFDLRPNNPEILSGSPFYMAIENNYINPKNLLEFGIQNHCNAPFLWEYAAQKGVQIKSFDELRAENKTEEFEKYMKQFSDSGNKIALSLDLDCITLSQAPGVSAEAIEGFSASEVFLFLEKAAKNSHVTSLGIYELNPEYDINRRTAKLTALFINHFIQNKVQT